jgi:hypothetical protein
MAVTRADRVMTAEELLARYAAGKRDFTGVEIIASDKLDGANLSETDIDIDDV